MKSKIYIGNIRHNRYQPVKHRLDYPVYLYAFDPDELDRLDRHYPFFGYNRLRPTSIYDADYLMPGKEGIRQKIERLLCDHGIEETVDTVMMITSARYLNYVFNPVSFHYCFKRDKRLIAIVAEVNNTYGERHLYVLKEMRFPLKGFWARYQADKVFHVSPFNRVEGRYDFYFSDPGDDLEIRIDLFRNREKIFDVGLTAKAVPMTRFNHFKTLIRHPLIPHLSIPRIYGEAFKLYFTKKLSFYEKPAPVSRLTTGKRDPGLFGRLCQSFFFSALKKINSGRIRLILPDGESRFFGSPKAETSVSLIVRDSRFFRRVVLDGEIGLGESYVAGEWETPDLVQLFSLLIQNRDRLSDGNFFTAGLTKLRERFAHSRLKNTITKSRENIAGHYDLGNAVYQLFLDRRMLYSCAFFHHKNESLEIAQVNKMKTIIEKARITPEDHILEIGCGWGGMAVFTAQETGCRVTGITVSAAQYQMACKRVEDAGLSHRITILLQDYRNLTGTYDKIISVEMVEAVGKQYLGRFFRFCQDCLKPGGRMVLQSIIIPDNRYARYCKERDWIQKHIFPGGHLPSLFSLNQAISTDTDFSIEEVTHIGDHYATTLKHWRKAFETKAGMLSAMGFDAAFQRKWFYYFSICEAGFAGKAIDDIHMVLKRAGG